MCYGSGAEAEIYDIYGAFLTTGMVIIDATSGAHCGFLIRILPETGWLSFAVNILM
jgi:hypothetical protein